VHAFRCVSARSCVCGVKCILSIKFVLVVHIKVFVLVYKDLFISASVCVCVLECAAPSFKQERSTVNSVTTLSPRTERGLDQTLTVSQFDPEPFLQ